MNNFTFPANKTYFRGKIQNFYFNKSRKFKSFEIDILDPKDNLINIDNIDYYFTYLTTSGKNKGGNSIILKLYESQNINLSDIEYDEPNLILKILKFPKALNEFLQFKSEKRFKKEISALKECKKRRFQNIIEIENDGICKIFNSKKRKFEEYLYYTMEYAEFDLKQFLEANVNLSLDEKIGLCLSLSQGIEELKSIGYYHRDIKPDNIFVSNGSWKIGDLGLISEREDDEQIDKANEFIGPRGWHSPEAMNKYLCEGKNFEFSHDCNLDHQSDIFQLGKVFWYILQNNAPTGVFRQQDTFIKQNDIYPIVRTMLNYSKKRRYDNISEVINLLKPIERKLQLVV
ncbi:MAG TPA: protein kinase family protein [Leeuwenhoekiella sp.]|nr:protein kinase family protein [Leeuwenhoekiella sp.]